MKDIMKLADGSEILIEEGASLDTIRHIAETDAAAAAACALVTPANLKRVEFWGEDAEEPHGLYDDLILTGPPVRWDNEDGTVTVAIGLREKTDVERRLDALEESQDVQAGAIEDLGAAVSEMMEG